MAQRRSLVAVCIAVVLAFAFASSSTVEAFGATSAGDRSAAIHRLAAAAPAWPDDGGLHADSLCWERDYTDPAGDAPIDAVAYRLTYDCQASAWRLTVTLAAPLDAAAFDSLAAEIDVDNDPTNGCTGFD